MPQEARFFVKTSLVYLVGTFSLGAVLAFYEANGIGIPGVWMAVHAHLGLVGWLVNLVIGIALWMLPLNRERFPSTQGRYPPAAPILCYVLLNGGLIARIVAEPWMSLRGGPVAAAIFAASGVLQTAGILVFAVIAWLRVRPPARPAPGVR
jgi:hypothetical protein